MNAIRREARENVCERVVIGFGFTSDWIKKNAASFFKPIVQRNDTKPITIQRSSENHSNSTYSMILSPFSNEKSKRTELSNFIPIKK